MVVIIVNHAIMLRSTHGSPSSVRTGALGLVLAAALALDRIAARRRVGIGNALLQVSQQRAVSAEEDGNGQ